MPFGFGFHPAFLWPLPGGAGQAALPQARHRRRAAFPAARRRRADPAGGAPFALRQGRDDARRASQFANDALLFPFGIGPGITFAAEGGSSVVLAWTNLPNFAVWQKPGAPYLCLEPWHGMAARHGAGDAMTARPSTAILAPGETAKFELRATFNRAGDRRRRPQQTGAPTKQLGRPLAILARTVPPNLFSGFLVGLKPSAGRPSRT